MVGLPPQMVSLEVPDSLTYLIEWKDPPQSRVPLKVPDSLT